ncbi:MAG: ferrochelatase, partial [Chloroflexi bacterium]|nr:ferrochelatase [Chloroflexota bacterium]
ESARLIARAVGLDTWWVAYQSVGAAGGAWLGPNAEDVVEERARAGDRHILIVPVGFTADHVEILYDIDIELKAHAANLGLHLERTDSLNDSPLLIQALGEMVAAVTEHGNKEES